MFFYVFMIICLCLWQPASAQRKQFELNATHSHVELDSRPPQVDIDEMLPDSLPPLIPGFAQESGPKEAEIDRTSTTRVNIPAEVSHGEIPVGVMGIITDNNSGVILKVLPGSDLNRFGVKSGDRIVSYDGRPHRSGSDFRDHCRGLPDTPMTIVVDRNGRRITCNALRKDARLFVGNDPDGYFQWCVKQIKKW